VFKFTNEMFELWMMDVVEGVYKEEKIFEGDEEAIKNFTQDFEWREDVGKILGGYWVDTDTMALIDLQAVSASSWKEITSRKYEVRSRPISEASRTRLSFTIPTFGDWLKSMGGINGVILEYAIDEDSYTDDAERELSYDEDRDDYNDDEWNTMIEEFVEEVIPSEILDSWNDWKLQWDGYRFPLELYRAIDLPVKGMEDLKAHSELIKQFARRGIGIYWASDERYSEPHGSEGGTTFIFRCEVSDSSIDVAGTIHANMSPDCGKDEQEVRLKEGISVNLTGIKEEGSGAFIDINYKVRV